MIRANCRKRFTKEDFDFIASALAKNQKSQQALLTDLLTDAHSLDLLLDNDMLLQQIMKDRKLARISPFLYFYVLTRKVFRDNKIDDRDIADYVACMLAKFSSAQRAHNISPAHNQNYQYLVDMVQDAAQASSFEAFLIRSHLGNYALFMTGFFPDYIYHKSTYGRKAPGFEYYEQMGKSSYHLASQHEIASMYSLGEILATLAERFRTVRLALNQLADNYVHLDSRKPGLDKMLRQIFFGGPDPKQLDN
ncbi:MAG: hypothetical protein ACE5IY_03250 [bacterium]